MLPLVTLPCWVACVAEEYKSDLLCQWTLDCSAYPGTHVSLAFTQLDTETDYDTITVFDEGALLVSNHLFFQLELLHHTLNLPRLCLEP